MRIAVVAVLSWLLCAAAASAQAPGGPVPPPPGSEVPPPPGSEVPPPPGSAPHAHAPAPVPPPPVPQPPAPPGREVDPDRRSGVEIVELYVAGFAYGALASVAVLAALDVESPYLYVTIPGVGGTAGLLTVMALDAEPGMRTGVPSAITTGMAIGLTDGFLLWGALDADLDAGGVLSLIAGATGLGGVVGGLVGYGLRPTVTENRLTLALALWGGYIATMSEMAFGVPADRRTARFGLAGTTTGMGIGIVAGLLGDPTMEHVGLLNGIAFVGSLVGLGVAGIIHHDADRRGRPHGPEITTAGLAIGAGSGLAFGLLTVAIDASKRDGVRDGDLRPEEAGAAMPLLGAAPLEDDALVTAAWTL